ncbi:hypothetical protein EV401DRAFT_2045949 [Pisolithus croceorrhizus]|nr:hypothetical protein EV401DRAFT_2045949 [Pisolithus croceorrhizus]
MYITWIWVLMRLVVLLQAHSGLLFHGTTDLSHSDNVLSSGGALPVQRRGICGLLIRILSSRFLGDVSNTAGNQPSKRHIRANWGSR